MRVNDSRSCRDPTFWLLSVTIYHSRNQYLIFSTHKSGALQRFLNCDCLFEIVQAIDRSFNHCNTRMESLPQFLQQLFMFSASWAESAGTSQIFLCSFSWRNAAESPAYQGTNNSPHLTTNPSTILPCKSYSNVASPCTEHKHDGILHLPS